MLTYCITKQFYATRVFVIYCVNTGHCVETFPLSDFQHRFCHCHYS